MDITPVIQTFHNKKGKTIQVIKDEIPGVIKRVRTRTLDNSLRPISCRDVTTRQGKVINLDIYEASRDGKVLIKHADGKNAQKTLLQNLGFVELAERFFK